MELTPKEKQLDKMLNTPVKPLILKLAVPTIISMLVTSVYNLADTYFVSQLGKSATGAVGIVFSIMAIMQALGFTLGMGAGSLISRALGSNQNKKADMYSSTAFFTAMAVGILLSIFGNIFVESLVTHLGATPTVLPYARAYAQYILYGAPIMMCAFVMNVILRSEGKAAFSMIGLATGGILNVILDPLFIYVFNLGISGAAIATLISQIVSFLILLSHFLRHRSVTNLSVKNVSKHFEDYAEIIKTGSPSFCRQGFASASTIMLNTRAGFYGGDAALAAMGVVTKIFMMLFSIVLGIGQGFQPVMGFNYGAKKWKRVKEAIIFTFVMFVVILTVLAIAGYIFAPQIISNFVKDPKKDKDVIEIGIRALRFQTIALPLLSANVICNMTFQSVGRKLKALLLSCCRQGIFLIPCIMILPEAFQLTGVEICQPVSDVLTFAVSLPLFIKFVIEINKLNSEIKVKKIIVHKLTLDKNKTG